MDQIQFTIIDEYGHDVMFKIRTYTSMQRVIEAYKERQGITYDVTLTLDGTEITIFDTPNSLSMTNGDIITVTVSNKSYADIKIKFNDKTGHMRVYAHTTISMIIDMFSIKYDVDEKISLIFGTYICNGDETMHDLAIKTGDTLRGFDN